MRRLERLTPVNRHLLVIPHVEENQTNTGVLLPDDYEVARDPYIEVTVVDVAKDCSEWLGQFRWKSNQEDRKAIVDRTMIQEVKLKDNTHYMILENYVVATIGRIDES